ncbi:SMP-30/gluconolactonase/LRE family protein [Sphingobium phenoxybenzoativorans]|uniref:SMP-30/gluconolactonase/LRE family protein n=1 Tax=Sphingobium phenoxybenzoativorans TaxID=1592790 RepID=UPI0008733E0E|nr:SMP-30/gluconolactonase/LRE family protein [Sphingobium phenoxybenzoativorans]
MAEFEILASGYRFVEAPRVDGNDILYFADLLGGGVHRRDFHGCKPVLPGRMWVGGVLMNADGRIICSGKGGLVIANPDTGDAADLLTEIDGEPIIAVNDIEAASDGGLYGGTIDFTAAFETHQPLSPGKLFHLSPNGQTTIFRDDVFASNGISYSPDRGTLYHSETSIGIWAWDVGHDAMLANGRIIIEVEDSDGLAVDTDGGIWVACYQSAEVIRYMPGGQVDRRIPLPFPNIISLDFGGPGDRWLYVSTGGQNAEGEPVGGVIRFDTGIRGIRSATARFGRTI